MEGSVFRRRGRGVAVLFSPMVGTQLHVGTSDKRLDKCICDLLSVAWKGCGRVLKRREKDGIERVMQEEQGGFRK